MLGDPVPYHVASSSPDLLDQHREAKRRQKAVKRRARRRGEGRAKWRGSGNPMVQKALMYKVCRLSDQHPDKLVSESDFSQKSARKQRCSF